MIDSFKRRIDYLRVSITDRCNFRCVYCMPPEGVKWKPHEKILTFEEILRIVSIMGGLGVCNIKITGGEPLLRRGASQFIKELKSVQGIEKITLTTNGILLGTYIEQAGQNCLPDGINISLDALNIERYKKITRSENANPQSMLSLIDRLLANQITVKINCVPVRNINDEEIIPLAALAKDKNILVRFIELMPVASASSLQFIPGGEVAKKIENIFGALTPYDGIAGNGPAVYYSVAGFTGKLGFINAVSHGFCKTCNRLRLTSEGFLKLCLFNDAGLDLRELIRSNASDDEIAKIITGCVKNKPASNICFEQKAMSEIGG